MSITLANLITLDVHNENTMKNLLVKGVKRINEFNWIMSMPYDFGKRKKPDEHNCVVKSVQTDFPYCYEYVGNTEILVITPLKEKMNLRHMSKSKYIMKKEKIILCYAFLVQILSGTGKTETSNDLARAFGKLCKVYNEVILKFEIHISIFFRYIIIKYSKILNCSFILFRNNNNIRTTLSNLTLDS